MSKSGATKLTVDRSNSEKPKFVYVVYIASTVEKVWQALTDPKMTEQYWFGYRLSSDWKVGSSYSVDKDGVPPFDKGIVLEFDPPRRLSYTWHPQYKDVLYEPHSRVTLAQPSAANVAVCSCRVSTSRMPVLTQPSYSGKR